MKQCFRCERSLPLADFYTHPGMADGHLNKCKDCTKADTRGHYAATRPERSAYERIRSQEPARKAKAIEYQRQRRINSPEKDAARRAVREAVVAGFLVRMPCEVCGALGSEAHHVDYDRPLDVRWLCFFHHREVHGQKPLKRA